MPFYCHCPAPSIFRMLLQAHLSSTCQKVWSLKWTAFLAEAFYKAAMHMENRRFCGSAEKWCSHTTWLCIFDNSTSLKKQTLQAAVFKKWTLPWEAIDIYMQRSSEMSICSTFWGSLLSSAWYNTWDIGGRKGLVLVKYGKIVQVEDVVCQQWVLCGGRGCCLEVGDVIWGWGTSFGGRGCHLWVVGVAWSHYVRFVIHDAWTQFWLLLVPVCVM